MSLRDLRYSLVRDARDLRDLAQAHPVVCCGADCFVPLVLAHGELFGDATVRRDLRDEPFEYGGHLSEVRAEDDCRPVLKFLRGPTELRQCDQFGCMDFARRVHAQDRERLMVPFGEFSEDGGARGGCHASTVLDTAQGVKCARRRQVFGDLFGIVECITVIVWACFLIGFPVVMAIAALLGIWP